MFELHVDSSEVEPQLLINPLVKVNCEHNFGSWSPEKYIISWLKSSSLVTSDKVTGFQFLMSYDELRPFPMSARTRMHPGRFVTMLVDNRSILLVSAGDNAEMQRQRDSSTQPHLEVCVQDETSSRYTVCKHVTRH